MNGKPPCCIGCIRGVTALKEYYGVSLGNRQVGKVQVIRQGLYYRFVCRCRLSGEIMCRLYAVSSGKRENLGLLVPIEDGFGIDTKVPVKRIGDGDLEFCLVPKHDHSGKFVPIYPEEPFSYIAQLQDGFLAVQNGTMGLMIKH